MYSAIEPSHFYVKLWVIPWIPVISSSTGSKNEYWKNLIRGKGKRKWNIDYEFTFSNCGKNTLGIYYLHFGIWYLLDCCWYNRSYALSKTWKPQCYMEGNISELFKSFWGFPKYLLWFLWFNLVELFDFYLWWIAEN